MNGLNECVLVLIKPDALEKGRDLELLNALSGLIQITFEARVLLTEENVRVLYSDRVNENYFPKLVDFLTKNWSILIVGQGPDAGVRIQAFKAKVREGIWLNITEEDLILLKQGRHPRQEEITNANALKNLIHVNSEEEGAIEKIRILLGEEYLS